MSAAGLQTAVELMRSDGAAKEAIAVFGGFYKDLESGDAGLISEDSIDPVRELPHLADLQVAPDVAREAFAQTVAIKLNGGLATSMGLDRAKSLLPVKDGSSFLDIIVRQVLAQRRRHGVPLPLIFMDSFRTRDDTLEVLARYPDLTVPGLPVDFLQNREPKLRADDLTPVEWPPDPELQWCPPGHADLYPALRSTGILELLLEQGYRYAFCSNADNLGGVPEPTIAGWLAMNSIPFAIESCRRTPADRKGGHLAIRKSDGRLILRETAQTSEQDAAGLMDLDRHKYCSSNNIWIDLAQLTATMDANAGVLRLPLIRNTKTVDPTDPSSPAVIQIESAMGAAVQVFAGARSVLVDRGRFIPVKTTNDLLVLRSDLYLLDADSRLLRDPRRAGRTDTYVDLDPKYFKLIHDFEARFPDGPPSLIECDRFVVRGDVSFGGGIVASGEVEVAAAPGAAASIPPGAVLTGVVGS